MSAAQKPHSEPEFFVPFAYSALDWHEDWLPKIIGYREERNPRWLWLRKRQIPIIEWPPPIKTIEWTPNGP